MRLNVEYLKSFIDIDHQAADLKELLASIGIEVDEQMDHQGTPVLEVEITPNRPDWLSHYGIAREISSKLPGLTLAPLDLYDIEGTVENEKFPVTIADPNDCGRFSSCVVRGIQVADSPPHIQELLKSFDMNPINNIVDISNLVLMTMGHPNHIYDLDKLNGPEINVRRGKKGEKVTLLDDRVIDLNEDYLVIADQSKPVGLGGLMGGLDTGVTSETKNILIECAYFNPVLVRKSAKNLDVRTDASYRFERGADILSTQTAIRLALRLIAETIPTPLNITCYQDNFPHPFEPQHVQLPKSYPSVYTGIEITNDRSLQILENLGFKLEDQGDKWMVHVPSYRVDIYGKQDLVEEIIRIHGYDKLESQIPLSVNAILKIDTKRQFLQDMREHFTGNGFFEVINYIFHSPEENQRFAWKEDETFVEIKNPIGADYSVLRNSLIPGMLRNTALNFNHSVSRVSLFEFGSVFALPQREIVEEEALAVCASGQYLDVDWQNKTGRPFNLYVFKSILQCALQKRFLEAQFIEKEIPFFKKEASLAVLINGVEVGYLGEVAASILEAGKISQPVFAAQFRLPPLLECLKENPFQQWNKFPSSSRDFSFLIDKRLKFHQLETTIGELKPETLESYELTDQYEGKNIPGGKVSFSMSFTYRSPERTLVNDEVNEIHNGFIAELIQKLNLVQR